MKKLALHFLSVFVISAGFAVFAGCATVPFRPEKAKPATVDELRRMGSANNGVDALIYKGSDAQFHYFHHSRLGGGGTYRLPRKAWKPLKEYPLGQIGGAIAKFPAEAR